MDGSEMSDGYRYRMIRDIEDTCQLAFSQMEFVANSKFMPKRAVQFLQMQWAKPAPEIELKADPFIGEILDFTAEFGSLIDKEEE